MPEIVGPTKGVKVAPRVWKPEIVAPTKGVKVPPTVWKPEIVAPTKGVNVPTTVWESQGLKLLVQQKGKILPTLFRAKICRNNKRATTMYIVPIKRKCNHDPLFKSFIAKGPRLWDDTPLDVKNSIHIKSFCSRLRNVMIEK